MKRPRLPERIRRSPHWIVLTWRLKAISRGHDAAGGFLVGHFATWLTVLAMPGETLRPAQPGQRISTALFVEMGGDIALGAFYALCLALALIAFLRLSLSLRVVRTCLLLLLSLSVGLTVVYLIGRPDSLVACDALLRAALAWWAYTALDEET